MALVPVPAAAPEDRALALVNNGVGRQALDMSLAPPDSDERCCVSLGPEARTRQYESMVAVAESQAKRLCVQGVVRTDTAGYDMDDDFLDDDRSSIVFQLGAPCLVLGGGSGVSAASAAETPEGEIQDQGRSDAGKVAAYLGEDDCEGCARVWPIYGHGSFAVDRSRLLPLPTEEARLGDWALAVGVGEQHRYLLGRRGQCAFAVSCSAEAAAAHGFGRRPCGAMWVVFEPAQPGGFEDTVLLPAHWLAALPPMGPMTPWEAEVEAVAVDPTRGSRRPLAQRFRPATV